MLQVIDFPLGDDFAFRFTLTDSAGALLTGRTDVTVALSDTEAGAAIAGLPASYAAAEVTGTPGTYGVTIPATDTVGYRGTAREGAAGWLVITTAGLIQGASQPVIFRRSQRVSS